MSKCFACGRSVETGEYRDKKGRYWCDECKERILNQWARLDRLERCEGGLQRAIKFIVKEEYCVKPKEYCRASADECQKCWLDYLMKGEGK